MKYGPAIWSGVKFLVGAFVSVVVGYEIGEEIAENKNDTSSSSLKSNSVEASTTTLPQTVENNTSVSKSASTDKDETISTTISQTKVETDDKSSKVIFPENPNNFNPAGLVRTDYEGTKNGKIIVWQDANKTTVFEWNENPNGSKKDGPHYHIRSVSSIHYYAGMEVPKEYAAKYFPHIG